MTIIAYTGLPGSGKSYGVVENVIIPALKNDRTIVTNIPLKTGYLSEDFAGKVIQFDTREPIDYSKNNEVFFSDERFPPGSIFIIDECWRYWPSGMKANNIPEAEKSFFTEHRHNVGDDGLTSEIVLVTQGLNQVAAFVRELVEETYFAQKLSKLGMSNRYQVRVFSLAAVGQKPPNQVIQTLQGTYKKEIFRYYQSHTKNKTDFASGMEQKADDRGNALKNKWLWSGGVAAIFMFYFGITGVLDYFQSKKAPVVVDGQTVENPGQNLPAPSSKVNRISADGSIEEIIDDVNSPQALISADQATYNINTGHLKLSDEWRITGHVNDKFYIYSQSRGTRIISTSVCSVLLSTSEDFCVYDHELVTWYSSEVPRQPGDRRTTVTESVKQSL